MRSPSNTPSRSLGTLALQGGPISWVGTHRVHHAHSDHEGDPHNANLGFFWSHFEWLLYSKAHSREHGDEYRRAVTDLRADPYYVFLEKNQLQLQAVLAVLLFALGGWSWIIWGIFLRTVVVYQITWLVNSASHTTGYRTYRTTDRSTNCWWLAIVGWGEGWHNNHHAFPFSARHGLQWYEFDLTWITIRLLAFARLAKDIKLPTPEMRRRLRLTSQSYLPRVPNVGMDDTARQRPRGVGNGREHVPGNEPRTSSPGRTRRYRREGRLLSPRPPWVFNTHSRYRPHCELGHRNADHRREHFRRRVWSAPTSIALRICRTCKRVSKAAGASAYAERVRTSHGRHTRFGMRLTVSAPTGTDDPAHLINVGSNRWAFKPEVGFEQPMGKWFADLSGGAWIFGANTNYLEGGSSGRRRLRCFNFTAACSVPADGGAR